MINVLITSAGSTPAQILAKNIILDSRVNKLVLTDAKPKNTISTFHLLQYINKHDKIGTEIIFYQVSKSTNSKYSDDINKICIDENIDIVIPILNEDILNIHNKVPNTMTNDDSIIFCDKYETAKQFKLNNIPHPETYMYNRYCVNSLEYPIIIKPCIGTGGKDNTIITNKNDLISYSTNFNFLSKMIIQEYIQNSTEFTTDIVCNKQGIILGMCTRKRISTKNGLCTEAETVNYPIINELSERICNTFKFYGQINIQYLLTNNNIYVLEINPRPAGSASISYKAGLPIAQMIIDAHLNIKRTYPIPKIGIKMLRYWSEIFI